MNKKVKVALVDDHVLLRKGLANLINDLDYEVNVECSNGKDFINKIDKNNLPDVVLMDINMPEMDGYDTTLWLKNNLPLVKVLALSMYDNEISIIKMIKNGARGYIIKDSDPLILKTAIDSIISKDFYYSEMVTGRLVHSIREMDEQDNCNRQLSKLTEKEITFLKLICEELTYKEIADKMRLSPRTVDGYRDELFKKLEVKSRVGLVIFAIKNGIFEIDTPAFHH